MARRLVRMKQNDNDADDRARKAAPKVRRNGPSGPYLIPAMNGQPAKLPVPDAKHRAMAKEALSPSGFRGRRVQAPPAALAKARKALGMTKAVGVRKKSGTGKPYAFDGSYRGGR